MRSQAYGSDPSAAASTSRRISVVLAAGVLVAAVLSIVGLLTPIYRLTDWNGDGIIIKFNAAVGLVLSSAAVLIRVRAPSQKAIIRALAVSAGLIGIATLIEHLLSIDLGIDNLIFTEHGSMNATVAPGRMGPPASLMLTLLGVATVLSTLGPRQTRIASGSALAVLVVVSSSLTGYAFGADQLYAIPHYTGIALQSALMFAALGVALVAAIPEHGLAAALVRADSGGALFRRLILPVIGVALVLGWVRIVGQNVGLYDTAFGTAARTVAEMVLLVALLWWAANGATRADRRVRAISRVPEENPSPVIRLTPDGEILYANPASAELVKALQSSPDGAVAARVTAAARDAYYADEQRSVEFSFEGCTYLAVVAPVCDEGHVNLYASDITARIAAEETVAAQAREQSVLYHLTDSVHRADTIDEIYEAAMTAILQGAQCDRAAILLFDGEGSMSFVASRGLSENYRSAVVGHSPWEPGDRNSVPITIADITRAEITEELRRAIMSEGICALGFIPLQSSAGDVIGKFMIYYDEIHEWTDAELEFASTIARQIAFGLERKVTEQALRDNEERLRLATQTGKVGIWDWDISADRVAWTESLYAMHGLEPGGFDGTSAGFAGLLHPDDAARVDSALKAALAGEQNYELEFRIIKPDGAVGWLFTNATIVGDGDHRRMVGATVDITELKQAELATERLAAIVESSQDAIIGLDLQGTITSWNKGAESIFKYAAVEAIGRSVLMLLPEERWPEEIEILDRIRRGDVIEHYETIRLRKDGQPLEISLSISPLRNSSGEVIGASKIGRDITHRKRAETAIRARETLQRIVEAQEAERSRIARDLHDHLGQQLTGLRLKLESMKPTMTGDASASNSIEQACRQAKQIDSDLSLLAWELRPVSSESHGLHEVLGSFVRDWGQSHGIRAEFQCVSRNGRLEAEVENNLYRIAQEALNNILKHAAATEVSVTLNQNGRETVLVVEDNGRGFDHEKTAASSAGGLGLVGMRERAALLGGRLEIESTAGGGTAIYARVPTHPTPKAATGLN